MVTDIPRQSRIDAPGALQHVSIRRIDSKAIFTDDTDRAEFLERIESIVADSSTPCFAWALMTMAKPLLKGQDRIKGDERILGDSDFVHNVLERCNEHYSRRHRLFAQGVNLKTLSNGVADYFDLSCELIIVCFYCKIFNLVFLAIMS